MYFLLWVSMAVPKPKCNSFPYCYYFTWGGTEPYEPLKSIKFNTLLLPRGVVVVIPMNNRIISQILFSILTFSRKYTVIPIQ